jgi:hypothetical protein
VQGEPASVQDKGGAEVVSAAPDYLSFLDYKTHRGAEHGFAPVWVPDFLFDFQRELVEWSLRTGRAAILADCGLGKTPMELVWAENVARKTGGKVLILAPLAVSHQIVREAEKFGVGVTRSHDGTAHRGITVTNYERLALFNPADFAGVVCDESSILKSFDGARRTEITAFMRKTPYRLLATATAAPNDYIELGTSSEALGYLGHMDMLNRFFKNDLNNSANGRMRGEVIKWRFKGHAELPFWRWVCSWARAVRKPSDLGFDDGQFILPPLEERRASRRVDHAARRNAVRLAGGRAEGAARRAPPNHQRALRKGRRAGQRHRAAGAGMVPLERRGRTCSSG